MTHQENELSTAQAPAPRTTAFEIDDHVGAFVPHGRFTLPGAASGPLAGVAARAVVVLDEQNRVLHSELVNEIGSEPNYEAAIASLG